MSLFTFAYILNQSGVVIGLVLALIGISPMAGLIVSIIGLAMMIIAGVRESKQRATDD